MINLTEEEDSLLRCSLLLIDLDDDDYENILTISRKFYFEKDEHLLCEGDVSDNLYIILTGAVALVKEDVSNLDEKYIIETLGPGQTIGEMRLVHDRPCSLTVLAVEPTEVLAIAISQLYEPFNYSCYIALLKSTNRILSNRLFICNEQLVNAKGK